MRQIRWTPERTVLLGLLATAALYCRDLRYDFVLDDVPLILMNPTIASWRNWKIVFTHHIFFSPGAQIPVNFTAIHYRPVYMLWLMLNQWLFGAVTPWWHLTSLLLHLCAVVLVYRAGAEILKQERTAAAGALVFAFHPIHIESVSYVSASTDLLVTVFVLASFLAYANYRERAGWPAGWLLVSIAAAVLALLSKESALMYPLLLAAYELLRGDARLDARWKRCAPVIPFAAAAACYLAARSVLFGPNFGPGPGMNRLAALAYAPLVLAVYAKNLIWPRKLSFYYPVEWAGHWSIAKALAVILILAAGAWIWRRFRQDPGMRLLLAWTAILFITPLAAVSTFVPEDWVHDRHMYLVSVPFCLLAAALAAGVPLPHRPKWIAGWVVMGALVAMTSQQLGRFRDASTLWAATLEVAPRNLLAHQYRGFALWGYGEHEQALREFAISAELSPANPNVHAGYAAALAEINRHAEAAAEYGKALQYVRQATPYRAYILYRLAASELKLSRTQAAAAHISEALRIAPEEANYRSLAAEIAARPGSAGPAAARSQSGAMVRAASLNSGAAK